MVSEIHALRKIPVCESLVVPNSKVCPHSCRLKLGNLLHQCSGYFEDDKVCSKTCRRKFKRILRAHKGVEKAFRECDCDGDYQCITTRERFLRCKDPKPEMKSCSALIQKCETEQYKDTCGKSYTAYFNSCMFMSGIRRECTAKCKSAYKELLKDSVGKDFQDCTCDGGFEDEKFCLEVTALRKSLCKL